jgi:hypothetical protein
MVYAYPDITDYECQATSAGEDFVDVLTKSSAQHFANPNMIQGEEKGQLTAMNSQRDIAVAYADFTLSSH